ncbi:MAG: transporter associated domain-containing protein, partial [Prevotella sp.]|nr:transporter associated domain-containing protein [Prevotella sp.]
FEGKTLLSDVCKILGVDDDEFDEAAGDADSLAGLLLELKGDFLGMHEKIDYKNYTFEITGIDGRRISKIKVVVHAPKENKKDN